MNIFGIEINAQNVALAFTLVFLVFVLFNGLVGFARGARKSIFYLIVSAVVFGLGFGLMTIAISAILGLPMGKWFGGIVKSFYPAVTEASTAEDIILGAITENAPQIADAVEQGSVTASFVMGLVAFVVKLLYIVIIIVLAFTLFKLIADIIWLIIRPKKKDGVKPKKSFGGRMIGLGIGAFKGAVYSLLVFALIAGVASVATSALAVSNAATQEQEPEAVLVLTDKNATLITLDAQESGGSSLFGGMDMDFLMGVVGAYRNSVPGAIFDAVKIETVPLDEYLFDGAFSFDVKVGDEVINVKLRKEVETVANAVGKVAEEFDLDDISLEALLNIGEEGEEALKGLIDAISDLSILKVAIPVGLEIAMYSDLLADEDGNKLLGNLFTADQIPDISNALISDIKSIGYSLVDARSLIAVFANSEEEKDINTYLNLDPTVVKMLFDKDHLGGLDTIDILAPIGLTYLTTVESIKESLDEFGLSIDDLTKMPDGATWSGEISKLGDVYIAIQDLLKDPETGRVNVDTEDFTKVLDLFTEEKINNFVDVLFSSNLISNSIGGLVTFAKNSLLPEDFSQYIALDDSVTFDANECKAFLNAATSLVQSGIFTTLSGGSDNFADLLDKLNVNDLARYLSQSQIIRSSLAKSLDILLGSLSSGDVNLRFGTFDDWDDATATEVELRSVLGALKLLGKNLFNSSGESSGFSINTLKGLSEHELEMILSSRIMSGTIVNFLVDNSGEGSALSVIGNGVKRVNANPDNWFDLYRIHEQTYKNGNTLTITPSNKELDIEYNVDHFLIYCDDVYLTSVKTSDGAGAEIDLSKVQTGKDANGNPIYHTPGGTYEAYGVNYRRMGVEKFSVTGNNLRIEPAHLQLDNDNNNVDKYNIYANGEFIYSLRVEESKTTVIDLSSIKVGVDDEGHDVYFKVESDTEFEVYGYREGELRKIFMAILAITAKLGDADLDFADTSKLTSMLSKVDDQDIEDITCSVVINDALISAIEDLASQDGAFIYIPTELKTSAGKIDHDMWDEIGESANILKAIRVIFADGSIDTSNLKLKPIIDEKETILSSLVICETVRKNITNISTINVPTNRGLDDSDGITNWTNHKDNHGNEIEGELEHILDAISLILSVDDSTTVNDISADSIDLAALTNDENVDTILSSLVICETIRVKLVELQSSGINIPSELSTTSLDGWENENGEEGELAHILKALALILNVNDLNEQGKAKTIADINVNSIDLAAMTNEENIDVILDSLVICETIRLKLIDLEKSGSINVPSELSETSLDGWKNEGGEEGELAHILKALALILNVNEVNDQGKAKTIEDINADSIQLKAIVDKDNKDTILESLVICETIRVKLTSLEGQGIAVPDDERLSKDDLTGWKNEGGEEKELSHILGALALIINVEEKNLDGSEKTINNLSVDSINLEAVVNKENRTVILESIVITNTIKEKLIDMVLDKQDIGMPTGDGITLTRDSLDGWENEYDGEELVKYGEISHILDAIKYVLGISENESIDFANIDTTNIIVENIIENRVEILKSLVFSELIRSKMMGMQGGITIPTGDGISQTNLNGWRSIYDDSDNLEKEGEISKLLVAVEVMFGLDNTTSTSISNLNVSAITINHIVDDAHIDEVLKSKVLAATIKAKISDPNIGVKVEYNEKLSENTLKGWANTYDENDQYAMSHGEIYYLLKAIEVILGLSEENQKTLSQEGLSFDIKLGNIIDNKAVILHSSVITSTIKDKLVNASGGVLKLPVGWDTKGGPNYVDWANEYKDTYNDSTHKIESDQLTSGELERLLTSVDDLIYAEDRNKQFSEINNLKYSALFTPSTQDDIISSKIISETIIDRLVGISSLSKPDDNRIHLMTDSDRTDWWNPNNGELKAFLNSIGVILTDEQKESFNNFQLDINTVFSRLITVGTRETLLKSYVIADTLRVNFTALDIVKDKLPDPENSGLHLSTEDNNYNPDDWYVINKEVPTRTIEEKELWNLIQSIDLLLPDISDKEGGLESVTNLTLDDLFSNPDFIPELNAETKINEDDPNTIVLFLKSKIVENTFADLAQGVLGNMSAFINSPEGGYIWYEHIYTSSYDPADDTYEYDLKTILETLYLMNDSGLGYSTFTAGLAPNDLGKVLKGVTTSTLADAFVISRTFRGSIEKALNGLLEPVYTAAYYNGMAGTYGGSPIPAWGTVELHQDDYNKPTTKKDASDLLATNLDTIIGNIITGAGTLID